MMRVDGELAYVLHTRPFRESSQLVDLLTFNHGRMRVVARGARRGGKRSFRLSPFAPLSVGWSGRGDLKTLMDAEANGVAALLQGDRLYTGLYLNELLMRTLPEQDPHPEVYHHYQLLLSRLSGDDALEPMLRGFELTLLQQLGYGLVLDMDAGSGEPICPDGQYLFLPEQGLCAGFDHRTADHRALFKGSHLLAMSVSDYSQPHTLRSAKRLLRLALKPLLGERPLRSRELFMQLSQSATKEKT